MLSGKVLKLSHNFPQGRRGGFQVDSPVKKPVASEMPRSAPPYTDRAREEPCRGKAEEQLPSNGGRQARLFYLLKQALHADPTT
mgnify:CR=1 FL=1